MWIEIGQTAKRSMIGIVWENPIITCDTVSCPVLFLTHCSVEHQTKSLSMSLCFLAIFAFPLQH